MPTAPDGSPTGAQPRGSTPRRTFANRTSLERFVLHYRRQGFAPTTVHGYAQVLKTLCRLGHRLDYIPEDITGDFEMPRVPKTIIPTFSDEQLEALLADVEVTVHHQLFSPADLLLRKPSPKRG